MNTLIKFFANRRRAAAIAFGAIVCMNPGIEAWESGQIDPQQLVAQKNSYDTSKIAQEIEVLREQFLEKNRELQEYKSQLFRDSHPKDQAKIKELSQAIAGHEKIKQQLLEEIQNLERELLSARKHIRSLETSSDALSAFIQTQRIATEAERRELLAKIQAYEEELLAEQELNGNLSEITAAMRNEIATHRQQMLELEQSYDQELQDALQETAMLKFELADAREQSMQNEHALIVSSLNQLTMALDYVDSVEQKDIAHLKALDESLQDLAMLRTVIDEISEENFVLKNQNGYYDDQSVMHQAALLSLAVDKYALEGKVAENQEAIEGRNRQISALKDDLAKEEELKICAQQEKQAACLQHGIEKAVLENEVADLYEAMDAALLGYQAAISDYWTERQNLQEQFEEQKSLTSKLQKEMNAVKGQAQDDETMIASLKKEIEEMMAANKEKALKEAELENAIRSLTQLVEYQDRALAEANETFGTIQDYNNRLEAENVRLQRRLSHQEMAENDQDSYVSGEDRYGRDQFPDAF